MLCSIIAAGICKKPFSGLSARKRPDGCFSKIEDPESVIPVGISEIKNGIYQNLYQSKGAVQSEKIVYRTNFMY